MGYACPVCGDPQADADHLADHLAFTAMLGDDAHEDWLDEHVPDWAGRDTAALADAVTDLADEAEYPQVFEDTTGEGGHDHRGERARADPDLAAARERASGLSDDAAEDVLAEARELTREMLDDAAEAASGSDDADEPETE